MKPLIATGILIGCISFLGTACEHTKDSGDETRAVISLRAIGNAQIAYSLGCGNGGYATSLRVLAEPSPGRTEPYLDPSLIQSEKPEKYGYRFTLGAGAKSKPGPKDCQGHPTDQTFYATATPLKFNRTGTRSFATNQDVTVWWISSPAAPTEPFGAPAVTVQ
jgi:hypothetical protein